MSPSCGMGFLLVLRGCGVLIRGLTASRVDGLAG
jgi:hypothetical protein